MNALKNKISIAGLHISTYTKQVLLEVLEERSLSGQKTTIVTPYSEFLLLALREGDKEELFNIDNIVSDKREEYETESMDELEYAMEGFAPREKIILKLSVVHGKTHKEIAGFMNIPINTVSTIIARRKELLRKKLKAREGA